MLDAYLDRVHMLLWPRLKVGESGRGKEEESGSGRGKKGLKGGAKGRRLRYPTDQPTEPTDQLPPMQMLFDAQLASVRAGSERQIFSGDANAGVHYVVKRYAALAASMLLLMAEYESDESGGSVGPLCLMGLWC
jgi:hypothetical protein